ncbi:MAG: aconitase/3-isopropylmalate dehydratase large subunit family protein [Verrucomicrobiota bacterium]|nr:aconitase/3-isopropylmalate dehydratase large subunit family protein [Verrucomicrobiota bacterium]
MTITEKILARAAGLERIAPGDNIWVNADVLLTHDICGPGTIGVFQREFGEHAPVWDSGKIVIIPDHYIFTADEKSRRNVDILRAFVREQKIPHYYDAGTPAYRGVCHVALPDEGHVRPGEVIFGTDSHTCTHGAFGAFATGIGNTDAGFVMGAGKLLLKVPPTHRFTLNGVKPPYVAAKDIILRIIGDIGVDGANYAAMEFRGAAIDGLNMDERMTICNMAVEAGAKNGIIEPDDRTIAHVSARTSAPFEPIRGDPDTPIASQWTADAATLEPCVAEPHLPSNYAPARARAHIRLDRAYIGSCTGGKLTDFIMAASILNGRRVAIDTFLVPATTRVARALLTETLEGRPLLEIFMAAGCRKVAPPSCAACLGGPEDTFGRTVGREVVISTTNRNFIGRMGSKDASIYLASPLTAAASAITGRITDPREFM